MRFLLLLFANTENPQALAHCRHQIARDAKLFSARSRWMAARLGLEPRQSESESLVLPLHHRATKVVCRVCRAAIVTPKKKEGGAGDWIRTRNRLFTKQVLYR